MSIVGSAPGIGSGSVGETGAVRAIGSSDPGPDAQALAVAAAPSVTTPATSAIGAASALDAGAAPVDLDRVATIKKAIENNSYPVVPTKIADAMIAAGLLLRMPK